MSGNGAPTFVDTNIVVYAHDPSEPVKHQVALRIMANLWESGTGCVSVQVLQEFYAVGTRRLQPISASALRAAVEVLSHWRVHEPTSADVLAAIDLHQQFQISFWDGMIVHSARALGCSILWSEDLNHGQVFGDVTVRNPFYEVK